MMHQYVLLITCEYGFQSAINQKQNRQKLHNLNEHIWNICVLKIREHLSAALYIITRNTHEQNALQACVYKMLP
jgi:hypothetical protein